MAVGIEAMRIVQERGWWVIVRGDETSPVYFSFFVDRDKTSWSRVFSQARRHGSKGEAEGCLSQIRERQQFRRAELQRQKASVGQ